MNKEDFRTLVQEIVTDAVNKAAHQTFNRPQAKPVYTINEVTELFGVSKRHLQYLRDSNQISFIQNGRTILFRHEDLNDFFEANYVANGGRHD